MKTKATKTLTNVSLFASLIILSSCTKPETTSNDQQYRLTKITSHYFGGFADTTDYYTVTYSHNQVSKLTGKWNNAFNVSYLGQTGFNRNSGSLSDSCVYDNAGTNLMWAIRYFGSSPYNLAQLQYPTSSNSLVIYKYQNAINNRARITYNGDGDITSIGYYNGNPDTLLYTINISYSNTQNKLNEVYKSFTLIDPFSSEYGIDKNTGKGFPVNIHYAKKCITSFDVINADGSHQLHSVSYQFNSGGYITEILIDNKSFMSYEYSPH